MVYRQENVVFMIRTTNCLGGDNSESLPWQSGSSSGKVGREVRTLRPFLNLKSELITRMRQARSDEIHINSISAESCEVRTLSQLWSPLVLKSHELYSSIQLCTYFLESLESQFRGYGSQRADASGSKEAT